jgi:hypothetical protein
VRAGSLSEPRIIALLQTHFLCVHVPELQTEDLIPDRRDVALIRALDQQLQKAPRGRFGNGAGARLLAGEREVFLTPDGEIVDIFLSLNAGGSGKNQYTDAVRRAPEAAVARFFAGAAKALLATHGELPADFDALRDGTAPQVAAVAAWQPPPLTAPDGAALALRAHTRSDFVMYEALTGSTTVTYTSEELLQLAPAADVDATTKWPTDLARRLCATLYPKGGGVVLEFAPESITAEIVLTTKAVDGALRRGVVQGRYELRADTADERGRRASYRPFRACEGTFTGTFEFDTATGTFRAFTTAADGTTSFQHGEVKQGRHRAAVELLPHATPARRIHLR